jgi:hypothetical protein
MTRVGAQVQAPEGPLRSLIHEALAAIDVVHLATDLPSVPVVYGSRRFGGYIPASDIVPRHIELSLVGPHPRLSLVHEIGHFLDDRLGDFVVYSSTQQDSVLSPVLDAIQNSDAFVRMRQYLASGRDVPVPIRFQLLHWLEPVEAWARAYAQYITARSLHPALSEELKIATQLDRIEIYQYVQWADIDFEPVADTIEAVFRRLGWQS